MSSGGRGPAPAVVKPFKRARRQVLATDDWAVAAIEAVLGTTGAMIEVLSRPVRRAPPLRGRTVVLFFAEASTRTRVSFELAARTLSADVVNIAATGSPPPTHGAASPP